MNTISKLTLIALVTLLGATSTAFADPPPTNHNHWRNTNYGSHYVLFDSQSRTWVETVNCKIANRFTLVSNALNTLTLYDQSRNMTVRLDYQGMWIKASGAADFSFYQNGTFDTRTQFQHNINGAYTGAITKLDACQWVEWFPGASGPAFRFFLGNTSADAVEIYDSSRDMWVKMDQNRMYLRTGSAAYAFFKNGHW